MIIREDGRIDFMETVVKPMMSGAQQAAPIDVEKWDMYSHSAALTDGILHCESHDIRMMEIARVANDVQADLAGKVSDIQMFAEATFGEKGFFKGIWDFIVKCFTAVVDWVKSIFGKFVKVTEKTVKDLEKASNEYKIQSDKKKGKLAFTESMKVQFFKFPTALNKPEVGTFIASETLSLGLNTLWDSTALKAYPIADGLTANHLFVDIVSKDLTAYISAAGKASDSTFTAAKDAVESAVKAIRDNAQETGGFDAGNKEKKLKFFLNTLLDTNGVFKGEKVFRLTPQGGDKANMSAKEEFTTTFFDYVEKTYNGKECQSFITQMTTLNDALVTGPLSDMANVKNKLSEGVKYFESIKKEYEAISNRFVSASKSMSSSTDTKNEDARSNANTLSGALDGLSKVTSWYTSNVINTYAIADLCIGKSAANLIGALNLATSTISNVEKV